MSWYFKYQKPAQKSHPANMRHIVEAETQVDAEKEFAAREELGDIKFCKRTHGPFPSEESAKTDIM